MRQTRLTIAEMEERARFGIFRNNVNESVAWMACIQVCMRLEEMAAGQQPSPPAQVSQMPPGGHRGVYSITDLIDRLGALETWQKRLAPDGSPCLEERLHAIEGRLAALLDRVLEIERFANSPETAPVEHAPGDLVVGREVTLKDHNNLVRDLADQGMSIYRRLDLQRQDIEGLRQHLDVVQNHLGMGDIRHDGEGPLRLERIERHIYEVLPRLIQSIGTRLGALEARLLDHIDSHKRLFPGSLGPNPEDPRR